MMSGVKEVSKWVKNKGRVATRLVSGARTRDEVCAKIRQLWTNEWKDDPRAAAGRDASVEEALIKQLRGHMEGKICPTWTEDGYETGMVKAFRKARGAAGADGWHGDEINALPDSVALIFHKITVKWRKQGMAPNTMHYIVQAALQKPGKEPMVENLRPLSLFSSWWRTFESATIQTPAFEAWKRTTNVSGVAWEQSAEHVAAEVAAAFAEQRYLGALNFPKAFDHMRPESSGKILDTLGVPTELINLMIEVWSRQYRLCSFDGHVSKVILETDAAHPQGGPWGPCVCQAWLMAGMLWTRAKEESRGKPVDGDDKENGRDNDPTSKQQHTIRTTAQKRKADDLNQEPATKLRNTGMIGGGAQPRATRGRATAQKRKAEEPNQEPPAKLRKIVTKAYMDDRNVVTRQPGELIDCVVDWQTWSKTVEPDENDAKTQLLARTKRAKADLIAECQKRGDGDWEKYVVDVAEVLGCSIGNRSLSDKERKRISAATSRAVVLETLRLPRAMVVSYKKMLAMPVLAYGWITHFPTEYVMQRFARAMIGRVSRQGAKQLLNCVMTHLHPMPVLLSRLAGMICTAVNNGSNEIKWSKTMFTPVALLRQKMQRLGWKEADEFVWTHEDIDERFEILITPTEDDSFAAKIKSHKKKMGHQIRESSRCWQWTKYGEQSKRHEVRQFRDDTAWPGYNAKRIDRAKEFAQDTVRAAILTGAVRSPACFQRTSSNLPWTCFACGELGTHDHVYWQCHKVQELCGKRPEGVTDPVQKRYGIPMGVSAADDAKVINWMKVVTMQIWETRCGNAEQARIKELSANKRRRISAEQQSRDDETEDKDDLEKWLVKMAAFEEDGGNAEEEEGDKADGKAESIADKEELSGAAQQGTLASGNTFSCGR